MNTNSSNIITISGAVRLPHVTLPAGTYIFELANPDTGRDVVRIFSKDRRKMFAMHLTYGVSRPSNGNLKGTLTLGERTAGAPPEVKAWFPGRRTRLAEPSSTADLPRAFLTPAARKSAAGLAFC